MKDWLSVFFRNNSASDTRKSLVADAAAKYFTPETGSRAYSNHDFITRKYGHNSETTRTRSTLIVIRTHFINEALLNFARAIRDDGRYDVSFITDETSGLIDTQDFDKLSINTEICRAMGLYVEMEKVLWWCGDYCLYIARSQRSNYDYYWLIEYDVRLNADNPADILDNIDRKSNADFLAGYLKKASTEWPPYLTMSHFGIDVYRCLFCMVRASAVAIDRLYEQRRLYASALIGQKHALWANDEAFCASTAMQFGLICEDLVKINNVCNTYFFDFGALIHPSQLPADDGLLYHSVHEGAAYLRASAKAPDHFDAAIVLGHVGMEWPLRDALASIEKWISVSIIRHGDVPQQQFADWNYAGKLLALNHGPAVLGALFRAYAVEHARTCIWALRARAVELGWVLPIEALNLALGCDATQSSTARFSHYPESAEMDARGATNGVPSQAYGFHTDHEPRPWWQVDLGGLRKVTRIIIHNHHNPFHLEGFDILLGNGDDWLTVFSDDTGEWSQTRAGPKITVALPVPRSVRYVRIQLPGEGILHLSQVEVYGDWWILETTDTPEFGEAVLAS